MTQPTKTPKHLRRGFVDNRTHAEPDDPPLTIEEIRRQLGLAKLLSNDDVDRE
jgi:hypothetical protein